MRVALNWLAIAIAVAAVATIAVIAGVFWEELGAAQISAAGWLALCLGVVLTLALGCGLMALVFISSRRGYDDRVNRE
jgi:hypothetical protein